jgi:hypothetical protein
LFHQLSQQLILMFRVSNVEIHLWLQEAVRLYIRQHDYTGYFTILTGPNGFER